MRQSGLLGYFQLFNWFNSSFSNDEKRLIKENFRPIGINYNDLIENESTMPSGSPIWLLTSIATNLINKKTVDISIKFLEKGEEIIDKRKSYTDLHFLYLNFSKAYKVKGNSGKVLEYAKKMINISKNVSEEFIKEYGKNEVSHQGFLDYLDYLEKTEDTKMISEIEEKASKEKWRGPWSFNT